MRIPIVVPIILSGGLLLLRAELVCAGVGPTLPLLTELCEALLTNVPGLDPAQLDELAANALVDVMGPRAFWADRIREANPNAGELQIPRVELIKEGVVRVRVHTIASGLAVAIAGEFERLARTTNVLGLVMDLRFAEGTDYSSLGEVTGLFVDHAREVLIMGTNRVMSTPATAKITVPVAVLINGRTRGAAEALAGVLPTLTTAIVIGSRSAGECYVWRELTLSTGRRLCVAAGLVSVAGGRAISEGVIPDICVEVPEAEERAYWENPYQNPAGETTSTRDDAPMRRRIRLNEAELERTRENDNQSLSRTEASAPVVSPTRVIRDPVLARAIDVLEAYRLLRASARAGH